MLFSEAKVHPPIEHTRGVQKKIQEKKQDTQ